jgi:hypothetical protein
MCFQIPILHAKIHIIANYDWKGFHFMLFTMYILEVDKYKDEILIEIG